MDTDIRWLQRLNNFTKALNRIKEALKGVSSTAELSDLEKEGLIQRFEYTYELAWKTLKDLLEYKGYIDVKSPNEVLKQAFADGYIQNHDAWRLMHRARNLTSHIYDEQEVLNITEEISKVYIHLLEALNKKLQEEKDKC
ncbi:MAG: nucleotidyltransferase substrate binding protein [Bacteroidales bacterium]|jgi:nucleotidyltransferase substrate binding protein (TIGR01987 family)|nr:nucleotidyltransferase substrate binding protein [Bacteroidales bacterium]